MACAFSMAFSKFFKVSACCSSLPTKPFDITEATSRRKGPRPHKKLCHHDTGPWSIFNQSVLYMVIPGYATLHILHRLYLTALFVFSRRFSCPIFIF